ncbi:hypothetical protein C1166_10255 [Enterobacter bugandensis]|uniref:Uncharacterized protein n=1 Tax=Enterobacter bugandensis TaxID=881260 RepID=A0ABX4VLI0_9ENTR|nr:hypothetical protein C1166_10255 [Enterobacter bugandensis]RAY71288.1 hypothetical protein DP185_07965 [Enterobacter hormaechei]PNF55691.1 hypothetical protein C1169_14705 [Enterobacter bugandensis]PNF64480.1 hypothetical protein C1168_14705 [Enterobacter bugandensis]PNF69119.1 hypothetical protein C1167_14705 [Enterobacter bugandensis]
MAGAGVSAGSDAVNNAGWRCAYPSWGFVAPVSVAPPGKFFEIYHNHSIPLLPFCCRWLN